MQKINIGTVIDLDELIRSRMLIQANSGGGKSAIARVIIEESYGKVPFIVMDIEGEYYTLKELYGDIIVIGGQHADAPISVELAKQLPKFIVENQLSVVIDVSDMEMNGRRRFAKFFIEALMQLPQQYWTPYLIFLEECHNLAGEQDKYESGPAIKDLMSRGRKRGYCGIPITQRISKLHKDVAAECNNKFIGKTFLDIDMDRSAKELGFSKAADRFKLRDLLPGCFYAFGTSIFPNSVHEVKVKMPKTKMPKAGSSMVIKTKAPTGKIISVLEKLNQQVNKPAEKPAVKTLPGTIDQAKYDAAIEQNKALVIRISEKDKLISKLLAARDQFISSTSGLVNENGNHVVISKVEEKRIQPVKSSPQKSSAPKGNGTLGKCSREIIKFLAQYHERQFTKAQVAIATGYSSGSGGFNNALSELHQNGFIIRDGKLMVNHSAMSGIVAAVGEITHTEYNIETYMQNLGKCEREIYAVLLSNRETWFTKEELSEATETQYSPTSGGFNNALSRLNTLELIDRSGGRIRLNPELLEL